MSLVWSGSDGWLQFFLFLYRNELLQLFEAWLRHLVQWANAVRAHPWRRPHSKTVQQKYTLGDVSFAVLVLVTRPDFQKFNMI